MRYSRAIPTPLDFLFVFTDRAPEKKTATRPGAKKFYAHTGQTGLRKALPNVFAHAQIKQNRNRFATTSVVGACTHAHGNQSEKHFF